METLIGTSIVAAFVAGVAALLAPCCVTVLLPSYLANVFKEKYRVFTMTFVFFLGVLTVFLPIGLGASFLAQLFSRFHNTIFTIGGIFLIFLGMMMLFGKKFTTPTSVREGMKGHVSSVYLLGIFSAVATTCCAPVLAGVLTLAVASGTILWGGLYTLAYVLGMTLPLFIIAAFLDKINITEKITNTKKTVAMKFGSIRWHITVSELISSLIFLLMGSYITYLALVNKLFMRSDYQLEINLYNAKFLKAINGFVSFVPGFVWVSVLLVIVGFVSYQFVKQSKNQNNEK